MGAVVSALWFAAGAVVGLCVGAAWAAYHGLETDGAAMRRLRRKHPRWFDSDIEYPPDEDRDMPDLSGIEVEA